MTTPISDGTRIRVIRAMLGHTSKQFCTIIGVTAGTLTAWEKGRAEPQRETRKVLAKLCQDNGLCFLPSGFPIPVSDMLKAQEMHNGK